MYVKIDRRIPKIVSSDEQYLFRVVGKFEVKLIEKKCKTF